MQHSEHATQPSVVILGGSGFVGRHLVAALVHKGYRVSIVSREPDKATRTSRHVQWLPFKPEHFTELFKGHTVLINLIGLLNEPQHNGKTFEKVHVDLAMQALEAAHAVGIHRYLHMSALGADEFKGSSYYQQTKGKAENKVHAYGKSHAIQVTSFRPSVIFGPDDAFLNKFAQLAKFMPGVFPLACAHAKLAPVCVSDVVKVMVDSIQDPTTYDKRIDLCGPTDYTLGELVEFAARASGHPRKVIPLPDWVARLQARVLEYAPGKPFTRDNYNSLKVPNTAPSGTPRQPTRLDEVASQYLRKH